MKKVALIPAIIGALLSCAAYAGSNYPLVIFNNSKDYNMSIEYYVCTDTCYGPNRAEIPSIKYGKNYFELNTIATSAIVTKVVENGKTLLQIDYFRGWNYCRAGIHGNYDSTYYNALVLDDMQGSDRVLCSLSTMPGVNLNNTDLTNTSLPIRVDNLKNKHTNE